MCCPEPRWHRNRQDGRVGGDTLSPLSSTFVRASDQPARLGGQDTRAVSPGSLVTPGKESIALSGKYAFFATEARPIPPGAVSLHFASRGCRSSQNPPNRRSQPETDGPMERGAMGKERKRASRRGSVGDGRKAHKYLPLGRIGYVVCTLYRWGNVVAPAHRDPGALEPIATSLNATQFSIHIIRATSGQWSNHCSDVMLWRKPNTKPW